MLLVTLDASGRELTKQRTERFFDPQKDPVTEKAARWLDTWLFVSFEGNVHPVDISGEEPVFGEVWSLHDETDRAESWRIGGTRHLAVHQQTGRLYALMHRGGPDTHKDGGRELWIYELADRSRTQRLELRSPGITFMGNPIAFGDDWVWPLNNLDDWLVATFAGALGVDQLAVTQDARLTHQRRRA